MREIIGDIKTYLKENYSDKPDFLMLETIAISKPKPIIATTPPPKKKEKVIIVEEPPEPAPSFITEKPQVVKSAMAEEMNFLYKKIAPHISLSKAPLSDGVAKQIRMASTKRSDLPE